MHTLCFLRRNKKNGFGASGCFPKEAHDKYGIELALQLVWLLATPRHPKSTIFVFVWSKIMLNLILAKVGIAAGVAVGVIASS